VANESRPHKNNTLKYKITIEAGIPDRAEESNITLQTFVTAFNK